MNAKLNVSVVLLVIGVSLVVPPVAMADECGDPATISDAYEVLRGSVLEVIEGDTLVVKTRPMFSELPVLRAYARPNPVTVRLVSIDAPHGSSPGAAESRAELRTLTLGRDVSILISSVQVADESLTAMLEATGEVGIDVGEHMLAKGLAKYRDFGPYAIDWWVRCHYQLAEARAKGAQLGAWSSP
jgi:endonuclease YncB( thermonuclease family)